ncbi:MAG: tetratricopeptide repeat protein [Candidatus Latescibacteria bacterium]|nr:tetratricopeptide repeat protein [Candidatus Latescibacterota bacterium]
MTNRDRILLGAILLTAFALRWLYILQSQASPFFDFPLIDAKTYTATATALASQGQWLGGPAPFWQPPLYPYFLALLFKLLGPDFYLARLVQVLVGTLNCTLVFFLGRRFFTPGSGLVAAAAAALYGPFLFYEGEFLPPVLAIALNLLVLLSLPWAAAQPRRRWIPGLLLGLAALCVANILFFLPLAAWWLWQRDTSYPLPQRLHRALPLLLGALLAIAPVTVRNGLVGGDWVLISSNAGVNFFIGNNADFDRTLRIQPGQAWTDLVSRPRLEAGLTQPSAQSRFFFARAGDFILEQPGAYLWLLLRKSQQLLNGDEIGRNQDLYFARQYSSLLAVLLWKYGLAFPFGLVVPLALLGILLRRRHHDQQLLLLYLGVYALSIVLFFVSARYRLPLVPVLLLFAIQGVQVGWRRLQNGAAPVRTGLVVTSVTFFLLANIGSGSMDLDGNAETHHRLGYVFHQKGLLANATAHYQRALELDPAIPEARYNLGVVHALQGRYNRALETFRGYLERFPESHEARYALGNALLKTQRYHQAIAQYEQLLQLQTTIDPVALQGRLAYTYLQADQPEQAAQAYRTLLQARPDSLAVRYQLGRLHESRDRSALAQQQYGEILQRDPGHAEARLRLAGILLVEAADPAGAKHHLQQLLEYDPDHIGARWLLATQYVTEHDGAAALAQAEAILQLDPGHKQANWLAGHLHYIVRGDTLAGVDRLEQLKKVHVKERAAQFEEALKQSMLDMLGP